MEFSQTAEYALRAMAFLATLDDDGMPLRTPDLARAASIPLHYLSKVMRRMVVARLVRSQKGHGGGFVLARPPAEIRFVDVLVAAGYPMEPDRCAFGWGRCNPTSPCPLHPTFSKLDLAMTEWAYRTTLGDVRRDQRMIERVRTSLSSRTPPPTPATPRHRLTGPRSRLRRPLRG